MAGAGPLSWVHENRQPGQSGGSCELPLKDSKLDSAEGIKRWGEISLPSGSLQFYCNLIRSLWALQSTTGRRRRKPQRLLRGLWVWPYMTAKVYVYRVRRRASKKKNDLSSGFRVVPLLLSCALKIGPILLPRWLSIFKTLHFCVYFIHLTGVAWVTSHPLPQVDSLLLPSSPLRLTVLKHRGEQKGKKGPDICWAPTQVWRIPSHFSFPLFL